MYVIWQVWNLTIGDVRENIERLVNGLLLIDWQSARLSPRTPNLLDSIPDAYWDCSFCRALPGSAQQKEGNSNTHSFMDCRDPMQAFGKQLILMLQLLMSTCSVHCAAISTRVTLHLMLAMKDQGRLYVIGPSAWWTLHNQIFLLTQKSTQSSKLWLKKVILGQIMP